MTGDLRAELERELDDIDAQMDYTAPFYLPRLIEKMRALLNENVDMERIAKNCGAQADQWALKYREQKERNEALLKENQTLRARVQELEWECEGERIKVVNLRQLAAEGASKVGEE